MGEPKPTAEPCKECGGTQAVKAEWSSTGWSTCPSCHPTLAMVGPPMTTVALPWTNHGPCDRCGRVSHCHFCLPCSHLEAIRFMAQGGSPDELAKGRALYEQRRDAQPLDETGRLAWWVDGPTEQVNQELAKVAKERDDARASADALAARCRAVELDRDGAHMFALRMEGERDEAKDAHARGALREAGLAEAIRHELDGLVGLDACADLLPERAHLVSACVRDAAQNLKGAVAAWERARARGAVPLGPPPVHGHDMPTCPKCGGYSCNGDGKACSVCAEPDEPGAREGDDDGDR